MESAASPPSALGERGAARWAHLPGGGRGIVQPRAGLRVVVALRAIVKPVVLFGFVGGAGYECFQLFPQLVTGLGK